MALQRKQKTSKPAFIGYVASSVDGRISLDSRTPQDWTSKEDWDFFQDAISKVDAVVVGRNTYETAKSRLQKRNTYVLTSRVKNTEKKGSVTFINPKFADLKGVFSSYRKVAVLGGSLAYQTMLEYGLLDEMYVTVEPLLFGRGVVMFAGGTKNTKLELLSTKHLNKKGTLLLHYKIIKS